MVGIILAHQELNRLTDALQRQTGAKEVFETGCLDV